MKPHEVKVDLPGRAYSVWVGPGLLGHLADLIPIPDGAEKIALVTDAPVWALHGESARSALAATGLRFVEPFVVEAGEEAKTMMTAESIARWLATSGAHRRDLVVALGGGVVGDIAGFAAATFARGLAVAQVPTTVLAQVDAAIGGKTGVNLPEGKNLVGAFHQPVAVVADTQLLETLPEAELRSGFAEVAKHGFIADPGILDSLSGGRAALEAREPETLAGVIARAAAVKARVVERDETERGERAFLNYGHTLGHALEALAGYRGLRHGEAVSIGMVFAARLAARLGHADVVGLHVDVLGALGLPTGGVEFDFEDVEAVWSGDKKYRGGMRFVILEDLARPRLVSDVPQADLRAAYEAVR